MKVKSLELDMENLVGSIPTASIRYERYLIERGAREPQKSSITYGLRTETSAWRVNGYTNESMVHYGYQP